MAKKGLEIVFDTSDLEKGLDKLDARIDGWWNEAREQMADTLLLLSREEVPHDRGVLQISGHTFYALSDDSWNVAYNTRYASYQHEGMRRDGSHVIRHYQKGRKKKYLEDPLKMNISKWEKIGKNFISRKLNGKI